MTTHGVSSGGAIPGLANVSITNSTFEDCGEKTASSNGSGSIVLFGYHGNATIENVDITTSATEATAVANRADNAIQITGFDPATYDVTLPAGNISMTNVSISGVFHKPAMAIQGFTDLSGFSFADVAITASSSWGFAVFVDPIASSGDFDVFIRGTDADDEIGGTNANDFLNANAEGDIDYGGNDTVRGYAGDDILLGGEGNDLLFGLAGDDTLYGGDGDDIDDVVVEVAGEGFDTLTTTINNQFAADQEIEELRVRGSEGRTLVANDLGVALYGNVGNDVLVGGAGNDSLNGGGGFDTLIGDLGDDTYFVSSPGVTVVENPGGGTDTVITGIDLTLADNVEIGRTDGNNRAITGNAQNNELYGSSAIDTFNGGDGDDFMIGFGGNDFLVGGKGADIIFGNSGDDTLYGGDGNDELYGYAHADTIYGDAGNDRVDGGGGADAVYGGAGADIVRGGGGNDLLSGGADRDIMTGGNGADIFTFADGDFAGTSIGSYDVIRDFTQAQGDVIDLSQVDAIVGGSDDAFTFVGDAAFSGTAGELRYEYDGGNTIPSGDTDGDGNADFSIRLLDNVALQASDFVF